MRHRLFFARTNGFQVDTTTIYDFTTAGSGSVTIPIGAKNLTVEVWAGGGGGGRGRTSGMNDIAGGGGGSGSYGKKTLSVSGYERFTINYTVGAGGTGNTLIPAAAATTGGSSTVSSGSFSLTSIVTNGGGPGSNVAAGAAATAGTGGDVNTPGNAGQAAGLDGLGGLGLTGDAIATFGAGTISIVGSSGEFSYSGVPLWFTLTTGMFVKVSGTNTGTGSITGYVNPSTYIITSTNGTSTFTLGSIQTGPLSTTAGTTTGLTFAIVPYAGEGGQAGVSQPDPGESGLPGRIRFRFSAVQYMAFRYKRILHGSVFGYVYIFEKRGDGIGMHDHPEDQKHDAFVLKGSFSIYGPEKKWEIILKQGEYTELLDEHHPHEVMALEDNSEMLSLHINGIPSDFLPTDPEEGINKNRPITIPLE